MKIWTYERSSAIYYCLYVQWTKDKEHTFVLVSTNMTRILRPTKERDMSYSLKLQSTNIVRDLGLCVQGCIHWTAEKRPLTASYPIGISLMASQGATNEVELACRWPMGCRCESNGESPWRQERRAGQRQEHNAENPDCNDSFTTRGC